MQDPRTGRLEPAPKGPTPPDKKRWQQYNVGEEVQFRGWWWEITGFTSAGGLTLYATRKAKRSGERSRPKKAAGKEGGRR